MKKIIITGAIKPGYGQAITKNLLSNGFFVIGTYQDEQNDNVNDIVNDNLQLRQIDHSSKEDLRSLVLSIEDNTLSGLINAQMYFNMEDPQSFNHDEWDKSLAINVTAPNYLFHELKDKFCDEASIVTITSTEGFTGSFGASAYAASKAFIHNLVKTHANLMGDRKIRSNAIAAGWIGGVMDTDDVFNLSRKITPLGRLGRPEEIAELTYFLINEKSSLINGTTIVADGGYSGVDSIAKYEYEDFLKNSK